MFRGAVFLSKLKRLKLHPQTGVYLSPKFGQHLTINPGIIDVMIESADIRSSDHILEIGPGTGNITSRLLPLARHVTAVELDSRFADEVRARFSGSASKLTVLNENALLTEWPEFDVLVANPPYNISTPLIFKLANQRRPFRHAILMLQKEFADRLTADPGEREFSSLSINSSLFLRAEKIKIVSGGSFYPQSSCKSAILKITPRFPRPNFDFREWDAFMKIVFRERRRCLHAVFSKNYVLSMLENSYKEYCLINKIPPSIKSFPDLLLETLEERALDRVAGSKLKVETLARLLDRFHQKGIFFSRIVHTNTPQTSTPSILPTPSFDAGIPEFFFYDDKSSS
jgi:18S rRNA (adenine1779-N6/adenine1780-N6)-dimethyltransferase